MTAPTRSPGARAATTGKLGERGAVRALKAAGFPAANRRKAGRFHDALDLDVCPGVIASVKAGEYAKAASLNRVIEWRIEAEAKRQAEGMSLGGGFTPPICLLIVQRRGVGPANAGGWRCWVLGIGRDAWETTLAEAAGHLRGLGYGADMAGGAA